MRKLMVVLFLALAVVMGQAPPGWCGEGVSLRVWPGLAGIYKVNQPVLIRVDIENRGDGFSGQLQVVPPELNRSAGPRRPVYVSEVEVPAGGRITCKLAVPGELAAGTPVVRLSAGNSILAESRLEGSAVAGGMVVMTLGEKMPGSSLFAWLDKKYGGQVTVKYLSPEELPGQSLFMLAADIIMTDREAASRLNQEQIKALKEWVRLGGKLVLSGGDPARWKDFSDMIPGIKAGEAGPFFKRSLGRGKIILSSVLLESITDPEGELWESTGLISADREPAVEKDSQMRYTLSDIGSYFPMVKIPGTPALALLWVLYALVAGPGLYLLLKRLNRRDLAWVLVPAVAVITALGFYTLSPVNRLQAYLAHTVATVEIVDGDLAEVRASGSFVLPRGGNLELTGQGQMIMEPVNNYSNREGRWVTAFNDGARSRVNYNNVEYGSMRQVSLYSILTDIGEIDGDIFFRENRVMGRITNKTPFNLRDCRILAGQNLFELGGIASGDSVEINEPLNSAVIMRPEDGPYGIDSRTPAAFRENRIMSELTNRQEVSGQVYFLGWSDSPVNRFQVTAPSGKGQSGGLTLVWQSLDLAFPEGRFRLPAGFIRYSTAGSGGGYSVSKGGLYIHQGSVQITYDLAGTINRDDFRLTGIEVPAWPSHARYAMEIYRYDTGRWEQVDKGGQSISGPDAGRYISRQGKIELKLTTQAQGADAVFPGIAVEGVIGQ